MRDAEADALGKWIVEAHPDLARALIQTTNGRLVTEGFLAGLTGALESVERRVIGYPVDKPHLTPREWVDEMRQRVDRMRRDLDAGTFPSGEVEP